MEVCKLLLHTPPHETFEAELRVQLSNLRSVGHSNWSAFSGKLLSQFCDYKFLVVNLICFINESFDEKFVGMLLHFGQKKSNRLHDLSPKYLSVSMLELQLGWHFSNSESALIIHDSLTYDDENESWVMG